MKYTFDRTVRIVIGLSITVAIFLLFNRLSSVLLPFLIGWLIAYLIHPMVKFVQNRLKVGNKIASIAITLTFIVAVIVGTVWALVPAISHEIAKASSLIEKYMSESNLSSWRQSGVILWLSENINEQELKELLNADTIKSTLKNLLPGVKSIVSGTWSFLTGLFVVFIVLMYVVFILIDYDKINEGFRGMIPLKYKQLVLGILDDVESGMNRYFRGQGLVALIVGILFAIGFHIIGLPMGITVGLFIGLLNLVPYLQTIGLIPVLFLSTIQSMETGTSFWIIFGGCAVVFVIVQTTQDMILVPKIMGKAMGLNPAVILLSLSVWGALLGIAGMIIALPFTTILISYYKRFILDKEQFVDYKGESDKKNGPDVPVEKPKTDNTTQSSPF